MLKNINNYSKILDHSNNIEKMFTILDEKNIYLKQIYEIIIKENNTIDVITTDTFAFQNNIFEMKIQNNKKVFKKISNQIYADYYKLIKYISQYVSNYIKNAEVIFLDDVIINSVKLIDNIHPYKINVNSDFYNIKNAHEIYNYIIDIIEILNKNYQKIDDKTKIKIKTLNKGINIENYINNINYNNNVLKNNIELFINFLNTNCNYHIKFLLSLENDLNNFYTFTMQEIDFNNINLKKKNLEKILDTSSNEILLKEEPPIVKSKKTYKITLKSIDKYIKLLPKYTKYITSNFKINKLSGIIKIDSYNYIKLFIKLNTFLSIMFITYFLYYIF